VARSRISRQEEEVWDILASCGRREKSICLDNGVVLSNEVCSSTSLVLPHHVLKDIITCKPHKPTNRSQYSASSLQSAVEHP
jgi:hypothetical protein